MTKPDFQQLLTLNSTFVAKLNTVSRPPLHHEYLYNIQHIFKYINLHEREKNNNVLLTLKAQIFFI